MNKYIGHDSQLFGIEEHRLIGGKGDGMRLYEINNGKGLELTVSPDRNGDISRLRFKGINMSYMSPCGYVAPAYYDSIGSNWLNSFTAGFLTTCGLNGVGTPCNDNGEDIPLHGSIANTPCDRAYFYEEDQTGQIDLVIKTITKDETIFGRKLRLFREIRVSTEDNCFTTLSLYHLMRWFREMIMRQMILQTGCIWKSLRQITGRDAITTSLTKQTPQFPLNSQSLTRSFRSVLTLQVLTAS